MDQYHRIARNMIIAGAPAVIPEVTLHGGIADISLATMVAMLFATGWGHGVRILGLSDQYSRVANNFL